MAIGKVQLERDGVLLEIQVIGRHVYVSEGGVETQTGHFDADAAAAAATALVDERRAAGWTETAAERARRDAARAAAAAAAEHAARHAALAAAPDPAAAFAAHLAPLAAASPGAAAALASIAARVTGIEEPSAAGFVARLRGGGSITWGAPELAAPAPARDADAVPPALAALTAHVGRCWVYADGDAHARNDHHLFFGDDAGPPEGDAELDGTALEGADVRWFLQELPWDRYWLVDGDGARAYDFDGGLADEVHREPLAELLLTRIAERLSEFGPNHNCDRGDDRHRHDA